MKVEQFVLAYEVEQDCIRALLPEKFESLRPVLRINTEIRDELDIYIEFNTPVVCGGRRGWLNIAAWTDNGSKIRFTRESDTVIIDAPFLNIKYKGVGIAGSCPAEKDNDGCFFLGKNPEFRISEKINTNKEFCDCEFKWNFSKKDAVGISMGKTLPAFYTEPKKQYARQEFTAQNAAAIECKQVLGSYIVRFER